MYRLLERVAPSVILVRTTAALTMFLGGPAVCAAVLAGIAVYAAGQYLDGYR